MRCKVWLVLSMICLSACAFAKTPADELHEKLSLLRTLKAQYVQTSYDPGFREKKIVTGDVVMARPNKFRWRIEKPYHQVLLSDAKKFYIYDEDLNQVVIRPLTNSLQDAPALLLIGETSDVSQVFNVRTASVGAFQDIFVLTPKDPESMIKSIELAYQGSALQSMRFRDTLDQVVDIQFTNLELNGSVKPEVFELNIPEGVDIIEE